MKVPSGATDLLPPEIVDIPPNRIHPLDAALVKHIADSIQAIGQQTPVSVFPRTLPDGRVRYELVAGAHRIAACKRLGRDVWVVRVGADDPDLRRWEVSENLHRSHLTGDVLARHIQEWAALNRQAAEKDAGADYTPNGEKSASPKRSHRATGDKSPGRPPKPDSSRVISQETGVPERTVQRALQAALSIVAVPSSMPVAPKPAPTDYEKALAKLYDARPALMRLTPDDRKRAIADLTESVS